MAQIGVRDDGERELLRVELEPVHGGQDDILRGFSNARVHEDDLIADEEVSEEMAAAEKGFDSVDVWIKPHRSIRARRLRALARRERGEFKLDYRERAARA